MPKEIIKIKTANGDVEIARAGKVAVIKQKRTAFGFKEESTTKVTKLSEECIHHAFTPEASLKEIYKND